MRVAVLGSGSQGNAVVVRSESGTLLLDVGFSRRELVRRLGEVEVEVSDLDAVVLTHEHDDHVRGADVLARRHELPLWATAGTLAALPTASSPWHRVLASGRPVEVQGFEITPFHIPHDAAEPVGLVVEDGSGSRLGLVADLGCRSRLAWQRLQELDILLLEANHDLEMLRSGPYPWPLKQRVAGRHGHLSNSDAAEGLAELLCDRLRWVVLYHLSRTNNLPALAAAVVGEELDRDGSAAQLLVSGQFEPTPWIEVTQ